MKKPLSFWATWLTVISIMLIGMSTVMLLTPFIQYTLGGFYYNNYFAYDAYSVISDGDLRFQTFLYGVSGSVLMSWGLSLYWIVKYPFKQGEPWAWTAVFVTTLVWFIGDGYASISTGFALHALINVGVFLPIMIPLYFVRPYFFSKQSVPVKASA
jgi:hypothetical protein